MLKHCSGLYCGRIIQTNGSWSECRACPRGTRVRDNFSCALCKDNPDSYSWMYLGFMILLPLMLHYIYIDLTGTNARFSKQHLLSYISASMEVFLSAIASIFLLKPYWSFKLEACEVVNFSDWYTLFYNPIPNYDTKLQCTQEAVYPLQTILLLFYLISFALMLIIRPVLLIFKIGINVKKQLYSALYFLPILAMTHIVGSGIIYFTFPYLSIGISIVTNALHYSLKVDQSFKSLISSVVDPKSILILGGNSSLLAYGIISLQNQYICLPIIFLPPLFYILTVKFSDPKEFRERREN